MLHARRMLRTVLLAATALYGCGGSIEAPEGTLRLALRTAPNRLDPAFAVDVVEGELCSMLFQGLVRFAPNGCECGGNPDCASVVCTDGSGGNTVCEAALCCPVSFDPQYLKVLPEEIIERDYGCGDPTPYVREGDVVVDLGSGAGKVCWIAAQIVGSKGQVIGVDMNPEMLALARTHHDQIASGKV